MEYSQNQSCELQSSLYLLMIVLNSVGSISWTLHLYCCCFLSGSVKQFQSNVICSMWKWGLCRSVKQAVEYFLFFSFSLLFKVTTDLLTRNGKDIAFASYSPLWKFQRKLVHSALAMFGEGSLALEKLSKCLRNSVTLKKGLCFSSPHLLYSVIISG